MFYEDFPELEGSSDSDDEDTTEKVSDSSDEKHHILNSFSEFLYT